MFFAPETDRVEPLSNLAHNGEATEGFGVSGSRFVCAFRGRRDDYQVPLALAEAGGLERFITDVYALDREVRILPRRLALKFRARYKEGIPADRVRVLWWTALVDCCLERLSVSRARTYALLDPVFGRTTATLVKRSRSHIFAYSPYAWEPFTAKYNHSPKRILFQYHPHPEVEFRILKRDIDRYPMMTKSFAEATVGWSSERNRRREAECWRHADYIVCASSFTRDTLVEAGARGSRCHVVPYGAYCPPEPPVCNLFPEEAKVLFVGAGTQRKGIHHLVRAWAGIAPRAGWTLTLVCRTIDPAIAAEVANIPSIKLVRGVASEDLNELYATSSLFVMPSLVEGFGQVYVEALSRGCPVLGTKNTCLPDIGEEQDGVFLANPGDVEHLKMVLVQVLERVRTDPSIRLRAYQNVKRFTWERFREKIREIAMHAVVK